MKRQYDSTGVKIDGDYSPAPEGVYRLNIVKVTDKKKNEDGDYVQWKTQKGDDYVSVECEIDDANEWLGKKVWYGVTFMDDKTRKGAGMAINFLKLIGEPWEGRFEVDTDNWIGKRFRAKLTVSKDNKGRSRNEIAYLVDGSAPLEDEIPF